MACSTCTPPKSMRDLRLATMLAQALEEVPGDKHFDCVWRMLFGMGYADEANPPSKYDLPRQSAPF